MKISNNTPQSFGAQKLTTTTIRKASKFCYRDIPTTIVELKRDDLYDRLALYNISRAWKCDFAMPIYKCFKDYPIRSDRRFLAITTQTDTFDRVNHNQILGLMQFEHEHFPNLTSIYVEYLQTAPQFISKQDYGVISPIVEALGNIKGALCNKQEKPKYKHVGLGLIEGLKKITTEQLIHLDAKEDAKGFYEYADFFVPNPASPNHYAWLRPISK